MSRFSNYNFKGQKALIRADFNVPLNEKNEITDDNRIKAVIPTITKILADGGSVILISHLGRPKGGAEDKYSLKHLVPHLQGLINQSTNQPVNLVFAKDCIGVEATNKATDLKPGEVLLLENLRFHKEEEKGDPSFAEKLAKLGDVYINDAFGTA